MILGERMECEYIEGHSVNETKRETVEGKRIYNAQHVHYMHL